MEAQNQEELQKQKQMMEQQQLMWRRQMMLQQAVGVIRNIDKKTVLDTLSKQVGSMFCPNMWVSNQLTQKIVTMLENTPEYDEIAVSVQNVLVNACNLTNTVRSQMMMGGMGGMMNPMGGMNMMGGMGMMNPMMGGMNMNPMMGMGMMNPMMGGMGMMGMGMNPMMGMQQPTPTSDATDDNARKIEAAKQYIKNYAFNADPLIFLILLGNQLGLTIDFTNDKNFEELIVQALNASLMWMMQSNPMLFQQVYYVINQLYVTDYYSKMNNGGNNNAQQMNPMMGMGMMNPMMGGMGMMGMGMNPMMGMQNGFDMNSMMNPMMGGMGMMGMNPMMGMGGMNMMGMQGTMSMPGMNNGAAGGCLY
jgi:hypothetical protein